MIFPVVAGEKQAASPRVRRCSGGLRMELRKLFSAEMQGNVPPLLGLPGSSGGKGTICVCQVTNQQIRGGGNIVLFAGWLEGVAASG